MPRQLQSELLDTLPPDHPEARHSRRDLRLINLVMGNHRWVSRTVTRALRDGERVLEIGAGTGELSQRLAVHGRIVAGLDLTPRPTDWPSDREWHIANLLTFDGYARSEVVVGNLIFHHFTTAELAALGRTLGQSVRLIVACEPSRRKIFQHLFALFAPLFRANSVTLHDARVSIDAGFRRDELPLTLGLDPTVWAWRCHSTLLGAYRMVAVRLPRP